MRILLMITRSESGGAQTVVAGLASEFSTQGHHVAIVSGPEGQGVAWQGLDPKIELIEIATLRRTVSLLGDLRALWDVRRLYRRWQPDIVHLHTSKAAALGRAAGIVRRRQIVYTMHGFGQLIYEHGALLFIDRMLRRRTGSVVAVSKSDLSLMRSKGYRAEFVSNGVPDPAMPKDGEIAQILRNLRSSGKVIVLIIAREAAPKRIDLARGASMLLGENAVIAWIGGEAKADDSRNFIALGKASKAASYTHLVDMVMLPSDHEGMPMSVLEGFAAGKPAIVSAVDGCLDVVGMKAEGEGPLGLAVPSNAESFAKAILFLASNPEQRLRMGRAARKAWANEYSLPAMSDRYLGIYRRLVKG